MTASAATVIVGALMSVLLASIGRSSRLWRDAVVPGPASPRPEGREPRSVRTPDLRWRWRWPRLDEGRAERELAASLPLAVELMAASVRSGSELTEALEVASIGVGGAFSADVATMVHRIADGETSVEALHDWRSRRRSVGIARLVLTCEVGRQMGAGLDLSLDALAAGLRLDAQSAASRRIASSQAMASAAVMILLPAVVIVGDAAALLATPVGWLCVAGAVVLDAVGAYWMLCLIRAAS